MLGYVLWFGVNAAVAAVAFTLGWSWHRGRQERAAAKWARCEAVRDATAARWAQRDAQADPGLFLPCQAATVGRTETRGRPPWQTAPMPRVSSSSAEQIRATGRAMRPESGYVVSLERWREVRDRAYAAVGVSLQGDGGGLDDNAATITDELAAETAGFLARMTAEDAIYRANHGLPPAQGMPQVIA